MNDLYIISASLLLLAASFIPKGNREAFKSFFGGQTTSEPVEDVVDFSSAQYQDYQEPVPKQISFPKDRALSLNEMYQLASHVVNTYGFVKTSEGDLVSYAYVESSFRPWVFRNESRGRRSTGLMQTLLTTAQDLYNKGYKAVGAPTNESLKDPIISMYFGAAYLEWLKKSYTAKAFKYGAYEEFFIRAYNGGAGWEKSETGRNGTANYLKKWKKAKHKVGYINAIA